MSGLAERSPAQEQFDIRRAQVITFGRSNEVIADALSPEQAYTYDQHVDPHSKELSYEYQVDELTVLEVMGINFEEELPKSEGGN